MADRPKVEKLCISIDPELLAWIDKKVEDRRFATRSHAFAMAIQELMKKEK